MTPYWQDPFLTLYGGDCREVLAELPAESVHCVVTSPPYWGLRDYGTATWDGGDEACDHRPSADQVHRAGVASSTLSGGKATQADAQLAPRRSGMGTECARCGAGRVDSQLGLELTPEEYVANMVAVFREVRRVLRADGTLWLNLGDSYAAQRGGTTMPAETIGGGTGGFMPDGSRVNRDRHDGYSPSRNASAIGLKHKDLVGIPWRVAFALQADGWYLRSDIIWSKPNPMPESVTDRPTKAHEYLFLLSKSPRYYYDADAVRETAMQPEGIPRLTGQHKADAGGFTTNGHGPSTLGTNQGAAGRNLRSVWTIATEPYPGAHFATFPRKLVEPCIKAGTSEKGVCPECGAPWVRVVEFGADMGWRQSCRHELELDPDPAVVLDPFAGSGTTLLVAQSLGRRGIGIDLSPEYLRQALERNAQAPLGLGA